MCPPLQTGNENQDFLVKWISSHADACAALGKPFVLEEFGKNVTVKAKTPEDWKAMRTPMFARAYSEYIDSLESGGNYQGAPAFTSLLFVYLCSLLARCMLPSKSAPAA